MPWLVGKIKPPFIALSILVLMMIGQKIIPLQIHAPFKLIGLVVFLLGFSLIVWSASLFKKAGTKLPPKEEPSALVIKGPFLHTRNPMYMGMTMMLIGAALVMGTLFSLLGPILFIGIIIAIFIPYEEKKMERIFGKKYLKYKTQVRRWC